MNASRTVAFAGLAPVAAAQDAPAAARPPVAGRPRGTARKRRPDPQWPLDRDGRGDALLLGGAEKQGLPGNRGRLAPPTPPGPPPTASPGTPANPVRKISRLIAGSLRSGRPAPHRCLARLVPGRRSRRGVSNRPRPPARAIAITSIGSGTARIAGRAGPGCSATPMACRTAVSWWTRSSNASAPAAVRSSKPRTPATRPASDCGTWAPGRASSARSATCSHTAPPSKTPSPNGRAGGQAPDTMRPPAGRDDGPENTPAPHRSHRTDPDTGLAPLDRRQSP